MNLELDNGRGFLSTCARHSTYSTHNSSISSSKAIINRKVNEKSTEDTTENMNV